MKDLKATRASRLLHQWISEGEHETQDFKYTVNDPRKIARSISAFANNRGGHLLIGVNDNGQIRGVRTEEDIYVVESAASIYCSPSCNLEFTAYKDTGGAMIIRAEILPAMKRPIYVKEKNDEIKAYFRVADENIVAPQLMISFWEKQNRNDNNILFETQDAHALILSILKDKPLLPEEIFNSITSPRYKVKNALLDLLQMNLIDFVYIDRTFHLALKE